MKNVIIFIKNEKELELAKTAALGKNLIEYTVNEVNRLDIDNIYLIGADDSIIIDGVIKRNNVSEIMDDLTKNPGQCLLLSPFYPLATKEDYLKLLDNEDPKGAVMIDEDKRCAMFMLPNSELINFANINYKNLSLEKIALKKINEYNDIPLFVNEIRKRINTLLIEKGVNIIDPTTTYISQDVTIDKNTTIYPNTYIEGKCLIGKDNVITSNTHLVNVNIGDGNNIESSTIKDSVIHDNTKIGPYAHIRNNSEIFDGVRIGNYVEIKNSKVGKLTRIAHLAYVGDATVGEDVNIGCGVITVNFDGNTKYPTIIKDHAFVGSNANLIAPITIGAYAMVAAGSTVDQDIFDGDMAISRVYQTNKKGYGYKYIKKEM